VQCNGSQRDEGSASVHGNVVRRDVEIEVDGWTVVIFLPHESGPYLNKIYFDCRHHCGEQENELGICQHKWPESLVYIANIEETMVIYEERTRS